MENDEQGSKDAVQAVERAWREGLRNIPKYRAHAEAPFTEKDYASIRKVVDQFGERYAVAMIGTLVAKWEQYREELIGPEDDGFFFPPIRYVCMLADSFALELFARGDILVEPRQVAVDWENLDPVEAAWRTGLFPAVGKPGVCHWQLSERHKAAREALSATYGEGRATIFVERVLRNWDRYRYLSPVRQDVPTLPEIVEHADAWIDLAVRCSGPPPYLKDSDAPKLPMGACGAIEDAWREGIAREFPACADEAECERWTERDEELIATVVAEWGDGIVLDAVRSFAPWWREEQELRSPLPSRDDFVNFCQRWCRRNAG